MQVQQHIHLHIHCSILPHPKMLLPTPGMPFHHPLHHLEQTYPIRLAQGPDLVQCPTDSLVSANVPDRRFTWKLAQQAYAGSTLSVDCALRLKHIVTEMSTRAERKLHSASRAHYSVSPVATFVQLIACIICEVYSTREDSAPAQCCRPHYRRQVCEGSISMNRRIF